ncbi:MAG: hypothetical protein IJH53_06050 [Oscillospiraceae bacterium]|nr:hypothetical protein [Oscillospiraceae bacterium]
MKRAVLVILILSLCLGLCACGSPAPLPAPVQAADPAPAPMMEAAPEPAPEPEPEPAAPSVVELTITTENFFDYFEYVEFPEYNRKIEKDSAGNVTEIVFWTGFYLKDGYALAEENTQDCKVEAGIRCNALSFGDNQGITVDLENCSYTVTGAPSWTASYDESEKGAPYRLTSDDPWSYVICFANPYLSNGEEIGSRILTDIELVSASGTLYFYE